MKTLNEFVHDARRAQLVTEGIPDIWIAKGIWGQSRPDREDEVWGRAARPRRRQTRPNIVHRVGRTQTRSRQKRVQGKTRQELRAAAKKLGIKGWYKMSKAQLADRIKIPPSQWEET